MHRILLSSAFAVTGLTLIGALTGQAALAQDIALVLGTERYQDIDRLSRGADITVATTGISALGFHVSVLRDGGASQTETALQGFVADAEGARRIIVALSGRFATDGTRTWFLTADAPEPGILAMNETAVSVDSVLDVLSSVPGRALLLLATEADTGVTFDPWLREGIGALDIPQGVTVVTGDPRDISAFMRDALSRPQGDLADLIVAARNLTAQGFLPADFVFMPALPAIAEPQVPSTDTATADEALWRRVLAQDNVEAYRGYLRQFPAGRHVSEAEAAISAILAEPFRDERLAEEALSLTRDQRRDVQADLTTMGFDTRGIDGIFGQGTRRAVTNWQQENGFAQTGYVTMEQILRLDGQAARREAESAAEAERQRQEAERLDRTYWDETGARGDEAGLRAYLGRYPQGLYAQIATDELARITAQAQQEQAARDRAAWNTARNSDTEAAYRQYLRDFPNGNFRTEADARIASLTQPTVPTVPDQPLVPDDTVQRAQQVESALNLNGLTARLVESRLAAEQMNPGAVDGQFDEQTRRAIRRFQESRGIAATGYLDEQTLVMILTGVIVQ